jgi:hypothetical protein
MKGEIILHAFLPLLYSRDEMSVYSCYVRIYTMSFTGAHDLRNGSFIPSVSSKSCFHYAWLYVAVASQR